jgi:hypothetical protein
MGRDTGRAARSFDALETSPAVAEGGVNFQELCLSRWIDDQLVDSVNGRAAVRRVQLSMTGPSTKYYTLDGSGSPGGWRRVWDGYATPIAITENAVKGAYGRWGCVHNAPTTWPWVIDKGCL